MIILKKSKYGYNYFMKYIDTHIHGAFGVNFNTGNFNEIKSLLKEFKKRNIVAICPTLVGDSIENLQERFKLFKKIKNEYSEDECYIIGLHLEGTFLNPNKPGIQDSRVFLEPKIENFQKLANNFEDIIKIVTLAPELDEDNEFAKYLENKNIRAHAGHTLATSKGAASATTHHFNAMPPLSHRGENLALDTIINNKVYCEIIADGVHVSDNMLRLFFKLKNNKKIIMISDALPAAGSKIEIEFCGKKISPEGKDSKGTLAGSVKLLDEITNYVIDKKIITKEEAKDYVFNNPLEHLNLEKTEKDYIKNLA